ncbi:MAG: DnaA/Hda family protein [Phycisphaerales bacterium]|nr:DnaA/Hda family protein [Phycisphaerales bacterium]
MSNDHASLSARAASPTTPASTHAAPVATAKPMTRAALPTEVLGSLSQSLIAAVGAERFQRDLQDGAGLDVERDTLVVRVSSQAARDVLQRRYDQTLRQIAGQQGLGVEYRVHAPAAPVASAAAPKATSRAATPLTSRSQPMATLADFVTGACNRLGHDAAAAVAEGRLPAGVPLVLFGGCGTGKTHLLLAMVEAMGRKRPGSQCRYLTAEAFMAEFGVACRDDRTDGFRKRLRSLDLLCLDDVQVLASKPGMQQELQSTLDAIRDRGGRVVMASQQHPRKLEQFSEALISRLSGGMSAELSPPDASTATKVVLALAGRRGLMIDEPVARAIVQAVASHVRTGGTLTIRDLEGAVTKVEAVHRLLGNTIGATVPGQTYSQAGAGTGVGAGAAGAPAGGGGSSSGRIGMIAVQRALGEAMTPHATATVVGSGGAASPGSVVARIGPRRPVLVDQVVSLVCDRLRVTMIELSGKGRHHRVVLARAVATALARRCTSASYPEIARAIGRPNHSTVITAHQRLTEQLSRNEMVDAGDGQPVALAALLDELAARIGAAGSARTA